MTRSKGPGSTTKSDAVITSGEVDFGGLSDLLGYHVRRAQGAVHRDLMQTLGDVKLSQKQVAVLWLARCNTGVSQGSIGAVLGMDRATMMALVDRLEARGLLVRERSVVDARRRELRLTPAGEKLFGKARSRIAAHEARMKRQFTPQELRTLINMLRRFESG